MTDNKFNFLVVGSSGLCGGAFIKYLNKYKAQENTNSIINSVIRTPYDSEFYKLNEINDESNIASIIEKDSSKWASETFNSINNGDGSSKKIYLSGLGTTKATSGGIENQRKIDLELNYELAKKARELGYTTCVLVSSAGASSKSMFPYFKMKGELEDRLKTLEFENLVILRPGALLGHRLKDHDGLGSNITPFIFGLFYGTWFSKFLGHPVYGDSVGKAGVEVAINLESKNEKKGVTIISSKEIVEMATTK
ncbi:related to Protein FMP52, mitochondrial [Hanseniaspora guilliermondii]|uniref:Related to Protein FMP52, mitochondrial n=1 Tax=Hanseniaspora guilliermondii TaxID=56406 RepID=A0A1L0FFL6_9ASCO|nr:related to Protein FMP52, mitochondrial [Hanseniaspora guilliermondii]